jgi:N-glycosylase/DNA lyase
MQVEYLIDKTRVTGAALDLKLTLCDSAQVFHWIEMNNGYAAVVDGRAIHIAAADNGFEMRGCGLSDFTFWRDYFDLDRNYGALVNSCAEYPVAARAIALLPGLRVLRQPAWEALAAFILSANNNVPRIRRLVLKLCESLGDPSGMDGLSGFPPPEKLAGAEEAALFKLGMGYRAPYLIETAKMIAEGFPLSKMKDLPYEEAHESMLALKGVGPKVADCALLFGCGHTRAFPVDVWVSRLMKHWFGVEAKSARAVGEAAYKMFGENAGLIQQFLFHCARLNLIETPRGAIQKPTP